MYFVIYENISCLCYSSPFLERLFKWLGWEVKNCLYCGREGKPDDYMNFVHCAFADCDGKYSKISKI